MRRVAIISAILESPAGTQQAFNELVSDFHSIVRGRMGIPFDNGHSHIAVISITVCGELDEINTFTGKLGRLPDTLVKTAISKLELGESQ
ncbi:MAG: iron-only hydrogenase system regulator [Oscillospiraceae bacterium]|jgi:putative iron-only hydrogenase system regulator|nr:iron-only hydrogenase system regulator [Oscillospiraceae bacterium]